MSGNTGARSAGSSGLLIDIEDACLFIHGIGPDRMSDAVCNIIRGPLIKYTQDVCLYYGISLTEDVESGPIWNAQDESWGDALVGLPTSPYGKLLLIPKIAVRQRLVYDANSYYTHYVLPAMQASEKQINSSLVYALKDGRIKVDKKALRAKYGADKLAIVEQTIRHPGILEQYRSDARQTSRPITHHQLAEIENIDTPRFDALLSAVISLPTGKADATNFENAIEKLLSALFFPSLSSPTKQLRIHEGRKRIDISYVNNPNSGFFHWLASHYPSGHIFVECKNYREEVANPEFDQLSGRFSPSRGQVGLLICRSIEDVDKLTRSCKNTAQDKRGFIVILSDDDLVRLVKDYVSSNGGSEYPLLFEKFNKLVM